MIGHSSAVAHHGTRCRDRGWGRVPGVSDSTDGILGAGNARGHTRGCSGRGNGSHRHSAAAGRLRTWRYRAATSSTITISTITISAHASQAVDAECRVSEPEAVELPDRDARDVELPERLGAPCRQHNFCLPSGYCLVSAPSPPPWPAPATAIAGRAQLIMPASSAAASRIRCAARVTGSSPAYPPASACPAPGWRSS